MNTIDVKTAAISLLCSEKPTIIEGQALIDVKKLDSLMKTILGPEWKETDYSC